MTRHKRPQTDKSLGVLRKNQKTKPKSPELTGKIKLRRETFEKMAWRFQQVGGDVVDCQIAAWPNRDDNGERFLTVQFSPPYVPPEPDSSFDLSAFLGSESDGPDEPEDCE